MAVAFYQSTRLLACLVYGDSGLHSVVGHNIRTAVWSRETIACKVSELTVMWQNLHLSRVIANLIHLAEMTINDFHQWEEKKLPV